MSVCVCGWLAVCEGYNQSVYSPLQVRLLQEENDTLKLRQRGLRTAELERDELSRQLEAAKEDLLREQKQARLQREELSEVPAPHSHPLNEKKQMIIKIIRFYSFSC